MLTTCVCGGMTGRAARRARSGFTLAEVILVMVVGGAVLALVFSIGTLLTRQLAAASSRVGAIQQLNDAAAILPLDLRMLSPSIGDIRAGEARDTSLEFRSTVMSAVTCAAERWAIVLAPFWSGHRRPQQATPQVDDSLWFLADDETAEHWEVARIRSVQLSTGSCTTLRAGGGNDELYDRSRLITIGVDSKTNGVAGAPARITRPARYSLYKAGDGLWYLGLRSWNGAARRFNTVQPVSGPYRRPVGGRFGLDFRYYDSLDNRLSVATLETNRIARIEVRLIADAGDSTRAARSDSLLLAVALRNRR